MPRDPARPPAVPGPEPGPPSGAPPGRSSGPETAAELAAPGLLAAEAPTTGDATAEVPTAGEATAEDATARRDRLAGIALMCAAVLCFACLDASAKWVSRTVDPLQAAGLRYLGSFAVTAAFLNPRTRPGILRSRRPWLQCGRALCLASATTFTFFALRSLPLTTTTSIGFAAPLIVTLLAGPLLGERLSARRLGAVLVGFAGVLVITRPGGAGFHPAMLLVLGTALCNALYSIATRSLAARDSSETTMFYTGLVGALVFLPALPLVWEAPAAPGIWPLIGALVVFGTVGHGLLILAHKRAPASVLAPFFYAQILWATLIGFAVFGELPDRWTLAGGAVVLASGLFLLRGERTRSAAPGGR